MVLFFDNDFKTERILYIQHLVLSNNCCPSRNVGKTFFINWDKSNNLYSLYYDVSYDAID